MAQVVDRQAGSDRAAVLEHQARLIREGYARAAALLSPRIMLRKPGIFFL
jgi:hypothetical protein